MKKIIPIICLGMLLTACSSSENTSSSLPENTTFSQGRFIWGENGDALIILDTVGPCTMGEDEEGIFEEFTDGDLIEIEFDGTIAETYPGQIGTVYSAKLIEDGERTDIDEKILEDLTSMGWLEENNMNGD